MHDPVADVLRQRAQLESGAAAGVALSLLLHGGLTALAVWGALHASAPRPVSMVNIRLQGARPAPPALSKPVTPAVAKPAAAKPEPPKLEEPKIAEPRPEPPKPAATPPEKNTVPLSPFGRSEKKGSENPAIAPRPAPAAATPGVAATGTAGIEVPVGSSGITALEGGDFPYTLYLEGMQRKIGSNWFRGTVAAGTTAVIYFRIQRDGSVTDAKVATPSGNPTFDRAALSAVRSSTPLNPLPFGYNGTFLGVHLTFR